VSKNIAIAVLLIVLVYLAFRHASISMRLFEVQGTVETIDTLKKYALSSTNASAVAESIDHVLMWSTKPSGGPSLRALTRCYGEAAIGEMIEHLKRISGRDGPDEPKYWIDEYKRQPAEQRR
jgi:hypothetical protein